jgi:hypothetical protein
MKGIKKTQISTQVVGGRFAMPEPAISVVESANTRGKNSRSEFRAGNVSFLRLQQNLGFATRLKRCEQAIPSL